VASSADLGVFMASEGSRFYGKTMTSPVPNRSVRTVARADRRLRRDHAVQQSPGRRGVEDFPALLCGNAVVAKSHE